MPLRQSCHTTTTTTCVVTAITKNKIKANFPIDAAELCYNTAQFSMPLDAA